MAQKHNIDYNEKPMTRDGRIQGPSRRYRRLRHPTFTAALWAEKNPLLQRGELGHEVDTHHIKMGDGITLWNDLPYASEVVAKWGDIIGDINDQTDLVNFVDDAVTAETDRAIAAEGVLQDNIDAEALTRGNADDGLQNQITVNKGTMDNHIADTNNPHSVTKAQVGLGNVDNTSDLNKPISTATQTALDGKIDKNAAITGATHTKITYDNKGLVTGGTDITLSDVTDVSATATEVNYLSGTTSNVQDQIDSKADKTNRVNGAALSNAISSFYGTSDTAAATVQKEVSIPSITNLDVGTVIIVQPTVTSTVANSTLKLNSFDAYPMRYNNAAITTSTDSVVWSANYPSIFVFDGTYWVFAGHGLDSNTTYTLNYSVDAGQYTAGSGTYAVTRYSILAQKADGTWEKITATNASYSTGTSKSVNTSGFILNQLRYYGTTTAVAGGVQIATNVLYEKAASVDMRYSTNCGATTTWALGDYIYLIGTIGADGLFYLDTTTWWSNALPTTNDGKLYIRLGLALAAAGYTMSFFSNRPIFYHDGTGIKEYNVADNKQNVISDLVTIRSGAAAGATAVQPGDLATVATTGDYDDLLNKPTIPAAQVNSDWNAVSGVAQILNKPSLATVATTGAYSDLTGTPTIPTVNDATLTIQKNGTNVATFTANSSSNATANITVPTDTNDLTNGAGYIKGITSSDVTTALGYTPYSDANPNGYTSNVGTVTSVNNTSPDGTGNVSLTIPTVNDATITVTQNGTSVGSFTLNQASGDTIALTDTTYSVMTGATAGDAGASGLVPAPAAGDQAKFLQGDGTWANPTAATPWGNITGTLSDQTDLNTALSGKQATITGAATTITTNNLSAARALVSDSTGKVAVSTVTSTELGYMHGVTSAVQTQLNNKQATLTAGNGIDITSNTISVGDIDCGTLS